MFVASHTVGMFASNPFRTLLSLAVVGCAMFASSQQVPDQRALQAEYDKIGRALQKEDVKALTGLMTPDFKLTRLNGQVMTRQELEASYRQQFQMIKSWPSVNIRVRSVKVTGQRVEVVSVSNVVAILSVPVMDAKNQPVMKDGKMQMRDGRIEIASESRDVWVKSNGAWRVESMKILKESTKLDGKELGTAGAGG
jgi:ketosteroid isomerase-like protein